MLAQITLVIAFILVLIRCLRRDKKLKNPIKDVSGNELIPIIKDGDLFYIEVKDLLANCVGVKFGKKLELNQKMLKARMEAMNDNRK